MKIFNVLIAVALLLSTTSAVSATELINNGGFESGLNGWTRYVQTNSYYDGNWYASSGTGAPVSGYQTVGAASGAFYAISDQNGPSATALIQAFTVYPSSTVTLSFDMFINNIYSARLSSDGTLNLGNGNQFARVDILTGNSPAFNTTNGVLSNLFTGLTNGVANPYQHYVFDISSIVGTGGTYQLRFAQDINLNYTNIGIDNVSITTTNSAPVPEPSTILLLGAGIAGLGWVSRRAKK